MFIFNLFKYFIYYVFYKNIFLNFIFFSIGAIILKLENFSKHVQVT